MNSPEWIQFSAHWLRGYTREIAFSMTAMILVVAAPFIHAGMRKITGSLHWLGRYALFVFLTTAGFGLITNFSLRQLTGLLQRMNDGQLLIAVVSVHLGLAWLLKRDRAF